MAAIEKNSFIFFFSNLLVGIFFKKLNFSPKEDILDKNFLLTSVRAFKLISPASLRIFITTKTPIRTKDIVIVYIYISAKKLPAFFLIPLFYAHFHLKIF